MLKACNQFIRGREHVSTVLSREMPVISLSGLVDIAKHALTVNDIRQLVLVSMNESFNWFGKSPKDQFSECRFRVGDPSANSLDGFHVGDSANTDGRFQLLQRMLENERG